MKRVCYCLILLSKFANSNIKKDETFKIYDGCFDFIVRYVNLMFE